MSKDEVTLKPCSQDELNNTLQSLVPRKFEWKQLGLNHETWRERAGGPVKEQGVYLNIGGMVWAVGLCGAFLIGRKREDGSIEPGESFNCSPNWGDVIDEYADVDVGLLRNERGALIYPPDDDPYWDF